jgi:hypothetical protein
MKRVLRCVAVLVLIGAVINVAVAWWCALRVDGFEPLHSQPNEHVGNFVTTRDIPFWRVLIVDQRGATVVMASAFDGPMPPPPLKSNATQEQIEAWARGEYELLPIDRPPRWSYARRNPPVVGKVQVIDDARGWPMRSMKTRIAGPKEFLAGMPLEGSQGLLDLPRHLPTRPIPLGFVANSLIYGAAVVLPVLGVAAVRRRFRRTRSIPPHAEAPPASGSRPYQALAAPLIA